MGVCKACHVAFEPYGYTFEQFDQTGRYRPDEGGQPIDTATFAPWSSPKEIELANLDDLSRQVESSSDVQACVSGLLTTYFLSGGGGVNCLSEETRAEAISGERSIKDYLLSLAASGHFAHRVNGAPCSGE